MSGTPDFDDKLYSHLVKKVGALSFLFSDSDRPLIDSRIAEKLFEIASGGHSIARADEAFDVIIGRQRDIGVGVKTFTYKGQAFEKVQEFTKLASRGNLQLEAEDLAKAVVEARTNKIINCQRENGLRETDHFYHCLVRTVGAAFVHVEPYMTINWSNVYPIDKRGHQLDNFPSDTSGVWFSDGQSHYKFSKAKNVLFKRFEVSIPDVAKLIPVQIDFEIWEKLAEGLGSSFPIDEFSPGGDSLEAVPGVDYVVLPLYSPKSRRVEAASGINQWNAGGRSRKFGEAYIPIPADVHRVAPRFFPGKDEPFELALPNTEAPVSAKVCQDGRKALMSKPNDLLCRWLYKVIDRDLDDEAYAKGPNRPPFTYADLERIGIDSVRVTKKNGEFSISTADLGSYEEFLDEFEDSGEK